MWSTYYKDNLNLLIDLEGIGNLLTYTPGDLVDRFAGIEAECQWLNEIGNWHPGATDDINTMGYLDNQFQWGKGVLSFYRHPTDDFKCVIGTKNIIGR